MLRRQVAGEKAPLDLSRADGRRAIQSHCPDDNNDMRALLQLTALPCLADDNVECVYRLNSTVRHGRKCIRACKFLLRLPTVRRRVCCVTFAESEPYCHSILFVCLSVIPRPTAYHD